MLINILQSWLIASAAIWATAALLPGFTVKGFKGAAIVAGVLGLLQAVIGKLLFVMIGLGTLGVGFLLGFITRWFVTAVLLVLTDKLSSSLQIRSFGYAMLGAVVISAITSGLHMLL